MDAEKKKQEENNLFFLNWNFGVVKKDWKTMCQMCWIAGCGYVLWL